MSTTARRGSSASSRSTPGGRSSGTPADTRSSTSPRTRSSTVEQVLARAVAALGGEQRPGQTAMAQAVGAAMVDGTHLLVQAGTGTGKSLAYLVPSLLHDRRVVVATATLALQHQLVERDLPRLTEAVAGMPGVDTGYAVLKGRSNYACLHRVREGAPDEQGALVTVPTGSMAATVLALRAWAEEQAEASGTGERDGAPRHTEREWRQVSVNHRECLGAAKCPFGAECFAEQARERAQQAHLVVTNHSLLAIDAIEGVPMIPDYDVVVIDEAHELTARVTQAATDELYAGDVDRAAQRSQRIVDGEQADRLADAGDQLRSALDEVAPGRIDTLGDTLADALGGVRDAARACLSAFPKDAAGPGAGGEPDAGRAQARALVQEVFATSERMAGLADSDVLWLAEGSGEAHRPPHLCVAPLQVWGPMRERLLADNAVVFTSATLRLGGDFEPVAATLGLNASERIDAERIDAERIDAERNNAERNDAERIAPEPDGSGRADSGRPEPDRGEPARADSGRADLGRRADPGVPPRAGSGAGGAAGAEAGRPTWRGLDVGSPFDYGRQAILYVARHLPPPGRDGLGSATLDEIIDLVDAADGRSLGLFSSRRAALSAAEAVRDRLPHLTTLAQGEAQLPELARQFVSDPHTCLFGTLSLWQGLDVPGETCQLVLIDRIPFPRPDDPLMSARQRAADRAGGNGFMQVAATHAALLLAQGAGRLIRTTADRGVVAVLDPRLATARYGGFLRASLPPMWSTTDPAVARAALRRLAAAPAD